jgi:FixJ family two-component response regulator
VALVDYRLPGNVNGLDAVARLRGATPGLTAIIVSADTSAALLDEAARQGVPMLRKPVTEAMLAAAINGALAASAAAQRRTADEVRG